MGEKDLHTAFWAFMIFNSPFGVAFNDHFHVAVGAKVNIIHRVHILTVEISI